MLHEATQGEAEEAQENLSRYAEERDKIVDTVKRILSRDISAREREECIAIIRQAMEEAYYKIEKGLNSQIEEFDTQDKRAHERAERTGL